MSQQQKINEEAQTIVENANTAAEAAARNQKAKPLPDRNKWVEQQADRAAKQFDKAKSGGMNRKGSNG